MTRGSCVVSLTRENSDPTGDSFLIFSFPFSFFTFDIIDIFVTLFAEETFHAWHPYSLRATPDSVLQVLLISMISRALRLLLSGGTLISRRMPNDVGVSYQRIYHF